MFFLPTEANSAASSAASVISARQWPVEPDTCQPFQGQPDCRRRNTYSAGNLVEPDPGGPQTKHFAHLAHRCPLCWHPLRRPTPPIDHLDRQNLLLVAEGRP